VIIKRTVFKKSTLTLGDCSNLNIKGVLIFYISCKKNYKYVSFVFLIPNKLTQCLFSQVQTAEFFVGELERDVGQRRLVRQTEGRQDR